ncbi:MAG: Cell surface protein [uncultured Sulfurovum sp.]|uniref:Cell surface protein n=1 Tax=uncultured Sulfurovum sp. TaxID=269237 RepID=A0A6S6TFV8_9BACT|nr:MAG: Cell surface protein [uncultured Sulfurovum sp.]
MKLFLKLIVFALFLNGCTGCTNERHHETNASVLLKHNNSDLIEHSEINSSFESLSKETILKSIPVREEKKQIVMVPMKPSIESYSNLVGVERDFQLTVKGQIGANVYVDNMLYGEIKANQKLDLQLSNPQENYFEIFEVVLSNKEGMDSPPLVFSTTFQREEIDGNYTYYIPENVKLSKYNFANNMLFTTYPASRNEIVSLIIPISLESNQSNMANLNSLVESIQMSSFVKKFIHLSSQELASERSVMAEYAILTKEELSSTNVLKLIMSNYYGAYYYLYNNKKEFIGRDFHIKVRLLHKYQGEGYLSIAVVPNKFALKHQSMVNRMLNSQNIKRNTTKIYMEEEVLKAKVSDKEDESANFLFVIDDSGSMGSYQKAISTAAKEFALVVKHVGMNFRVAIITTGELDEAFEVLETEGVIENNIELFQQALNVGLSGSGTETAIYNIEQALASKEQGDKTNGILTELNMPKVNEKLSIIILSDEKSSYEQRAGKAFDINNNLLVNRGYRVYLIGTAQTERGYNQAQYFEHKASDYGVYGALVRRTMGMVQNIENIYSYDTMMHAIVEDVLGDLGYRLRQNNVIESTIYVSLNDEEVPYDDVNGWRYVQSTNSILFSGTFIPNEDDSIVIRYGYSLE